jgi:hypothetical protein
MRRFAGENEIIPALRLMEQCVASAGSVPQAFLCTRNFRIYCVHNLSKFLPALNGTVTPWDDGIFGFLGELTANFCTSIRLPPEVLTPIQVRAFTKNYIRAHLDDLNNISGC